MSSVQFYKFQPEKNLNKRILKTPANYGSSVLNFLLIEYRDAIY